jgi:hypothetical protein
MKRETGEQSTAIDYPRKTILPEILSKKDAKISRKLMEKDIENARKYCLLQVNKRSWPKQRIDEYLEDKYGKILFVSNIDQKYRSILFFRLLTFI